MVKWTRYKANLSPHLVQRLRMCGATQPLLHVEESKRTKLIARVNKGLNAMQHNCVPSADSILQTGYITKKPWLLLPQTLFDKMVSVTVPYPGISIQEICPRILQQRNKSSDICHLQLQMSTNVHRLYPLDLLLNVTYSILLCINFVMRHIPFHVSQSCKFLFLIKTVHHKCNLHCPMSCYITLSQ